MCGSLISTLPEAIMRVYAVSARYRAFLESEIDALITRAQQDEERRADDDERVQQLATVPDELIDDRATGVVLLFVAEAGEDVAEEIDQARELGRAAA
jgi:hypothetical protein